MNIFSPLNNAAGERYIPYVKPEACERGGISLPFPLISTTITLSLVYCLTSLLANLLRK